MTTWEFEKILMKINEGICGNYIGGKALQLKALIAGFYWSSMLADAQSYVNKCDKCQRFAPIINRPANNLQPISCPISFLMGNGHLGSVYNSNKGQAPDSGY